MACLYSQGFPNYCYRYRIHVQVPSSLLLLPTENIRFSKKKNTQTKCQLYIKRCFLRCSHCRCKCGLTCHGPCTIHGVLILISNSVHRELYKIENSLQFCLKPSHDWKINYIHTIGVWIKFLWKFCQYSDIRNIVVKRGTYIFLWLKSYELVSQAISNNNSKTWIIPNHFSLLKTKSGYKACIGEKQRHWRGV